MHLQVPSKLICVIEKKPSTGRSVETLSINKCINTLTFNTQVIAGGLVYLEHLALCQNHSEKDRYVMCHFLGLGK